MKCPLTKTVNPPGNDNKGIPSDHKKTINISR